MMKELNLHKPFLYTNTTLNNKKKSGFLPAYYQSEISLSKYLDKYGLFQRGSNKADAVILFSSSLSSQYGMLNVMLFLHKLIK